MQRTMLKSKIHRATVTQADLHYVGSVTIDADLMDAADLLPGEKVQIVDIDNGARLETYVIEGAARIRRHRHQRRRGPSGPPRATSSSSSATRRWPTPRPRTFEPRVVHVDAAEPGDRHRTHRRRPVGPRGRRQDHPR